MELTNKTPTVAEKEMYLYAGFYVVEETDIYIEYAVCYTINGLRKEFPLKLTMDDLHIDYDEMLIFDKSSERVKVNTYVDAKLLNLIAKRMDELGWK